MDGKVISITRLVEPVEAIALFRIERRLVKVGRDCWSSDHLQQAWRGMETGELTWQDVPVVEVTID